MKTIKKSCISCFKTLADNTRIRIIKELQVNGERNVTDLTRLMSVTQPTVSHHLYILLKSGAVNKKQNGKHVYYMYNKNFPCHSCGVFSAPIQL